MTFKTNKLILITILLLALFLRVYRLDQVPIELFGDEIDAGYQAYSILKTGQDYYGQVFPVMFHSFAEFRLPMFIYSQVPTIAFFGLNEWGVRLPSAFWGVLGILGIYLLCRELFNRQIGLLAALLLAISPWHLQYSRQGGIEAGLLLTFITLAVWSFLKGLKQFNWFFLSAIFFSLSFYTYAVGALFIPLIGISLFLTYRKKILGSGVTKLLPVIVVALVVLLPYLYITFSGKTTQRSSIVSIFADDKIKEDIINRRNLEGSTAISSVFHNKILSLSGELTLNYFKALSPEFLFLKGDPNLRQSVGDRGVFYIFEMILIIVGIYAVFKKRIDFIVLSIWLFLGVIPASLTIGGGSHASRLMLILIPLTSLAALGLNQLIVERKKRVFQFLLVFVFALSLINIGGYFHRYYVDWPKDSFKFWHYGYKEAVTYLLQNDEKYDRVYINNTYEPALTRFLFWSKYDPSIFHQQFILDQSQKEIARGFDGFKLGEKYYFGGVVGEDKYQSINNLLQDNQLYLVSSRDEAGSADWRINPPANLTVLKTVTDPFNLPIFYIVTKKII